MKKVLILLMLILFGHDLFAQNYMPSQHTFLINGVPTKLSKELEQFKQTEFMLGWQWGGMKRISEAEKVKQKHSPEQEKNMNFCVRGNIFLV